MIIDFLAERAKRRAMADMKLVQEFEREEAQRRELEDAINADRYARGLPPIIVIR